MTYFLKIADGSTANVYATEVTRCQPLAPEIAVGTELCTTTNLADNSVTVSGGAATTYGAGFAGRFAFLKLPEAVNETTPPAVDGLTYVGTYVIATHTTQLHSTLYLTKFVSVRPKRKGPNEGPIQMTQNQMVLLSKTLLWSTRSSPSDVPTTIYRFFVYKNATTGEYTFRCAFYPTAGFVAASAVPGNGFVNSDTPVPTDPSLVGAFTVQSDLGSGCLLPSTIDGTGVITTQFTYYITCPHATLNAANPAVIDYKQLQYSATTTPNVVAATGYDYSTRGWVFEAVAGSANTYKTRSVGNTANYILNGTNDAFLIEPHPTAFGAFSIRVPGTATLKTYLSCNAAGVMSWVKATSNAGANLPFFFRPGETSNPPLAAPRPCKL